MTRDAGEATPGPCRRNQKGTMRRFALITLFAVLAAGCAVAPGSAGSPEVEQLPQQLDATATTVRATSGEAPAPIVLAEIPASPLTDEAITVGDLALMPLRELREPFAGFVTAFEGEESNETATDELPVGSDEAEDIEQFGRSTGYRVSLSPTRLTDSGTRFVDNWVELFTTAQGASQYLTDYMGDLSKGLDAAHDPDLNATDTHSFEVKSIGDEAAGITLIETSADGDPYVETVIGMRIGRLLAFVSLGRTTDVDVRVLALDLASELEMRVVGVLDGSLTPVLATEPPAVLETYAFEYRQQLQQSFKIVESAVEDDGIGGGDGGGEEEPEEEPDPSAPTTVITWTEEKASTTVTSEGVVTPEAIRCKLTIRNNGRRITNATYVITDDQAWRSTNGRSFKEIDSLEERFLADLLFCPGWYPSRSDSGVRSITRPGRGVLEEDKDGTVTERYDLGIADLVTAGLAGENGRGMRVSRFNLWTGGDAPWVVQVDLRVTGPTSAMERAFGPAFYPGASVQIDLEFEATRLNDPTLVVEIPSP